MSGVLLGDLIFYVLAAVTIVSAAGVACSSNIVYSAFSLLGTFMGVAGLYVMLAADFVAVIQVLIYVGGIMVLMIFAVMLTHRIADVRISNRSVGRLPGALLVACFTAMMVKAIVGTTWHSVAPGTPAPTTYGIGNAFLGDYILPFELASVVLLVTLIGAVVLSRKELREG